MPGTRITDEDRKKIDPKFICTSCNWLLCAPMQTHCGHLMCSTCVQALLETSNPRCPADGTELKKEQVFPDIFTKRELNGLSLHCPNTGCRWHGTYDELEGHSAVCEYARINCVHSQCKMKLQRFHLGEHLKNECEYRNVKCQYCEKDVAFASIKDHVGMSCEGVPVTCKYCKKNIPRKEIERHERLECEELPGECEFQAVGCNHDKTVKRKELRQHLNDGLIGHVRLLLQYVLDFVSQLRGYISRLEFTDVIQRVRGDIAEVRSALGENSVMVLGRVNGLQGRVNGLQGSVNGLQGRFEDLAEEVVHREIVRRDDITSYYGILLWKIEGCQRKRQDAINGVKTAVYSPHFYSAQFGYKMCAKIYMNGDGFGKGSHLSLFFVVMRGEYDALQTWPFEKKITMMLLDQGSGDHMIDAFHSDPQNSSFERPKSDMNIAAGSPLFMPLDSLNNRQYIKDDTMFIKIIVE